MTMKLFGCSFTNWIYPTWADFVKIHYDHDVKIYGRPGMGNDVFKRLLLLEVTEQDHAIVMLSGNDRIDHAVEGKDDINKLPHYFENKSWTHSFPYKDQCFVQLNSSGVDFKKHFSLFHALYKQAEVIVDMQKHAKADKFELQFLSWQDIFSDLSFRRERAGLGKKIDLDRYQKNPVFRKVFGMIDFHNFLDDPRLGILNYIHDNREIFMYQNTWDFHPSCIGHFRYFTQYVKPFLDTKYTSVDNLDQIEDLCLDFSRYYQDAKVSEYPFESTADNEFTHDKFYVLRKHIIENYFSPFKEKLTEGYHYE